MRAIIVGGGINRLSTAIALRRTGEEATVFKRAGISLGGQRDECAMEARPVTTQC